MVHQGFSNQNLSKSPLGMACLNYSSENSPVTKLRFGKYRRGWIEKMRLVRRSKQTERVTTFLLPLLSMSQVEPTMPSFSKNHFPFLQDLAIFRGQLGWSLIQSLVEFFLQFQHWGNESKLCLVVPLCELSNQEESSESNTSRIIQSWIILNYPIRKRASLWKQHLLSWVGRLAPEWLDFQHTQPAAKIWANQECEVIFINHGNLVFSVRLIIHLEPSASE